MGPPGELYDNPVNLFVAEFIGSPPMNVCRARIAHGEEGVECQVGAQRLPLSGRRVEVLAPLVGRDVALGIRPDHLLDPVRGRNGLPHPRGTVTGNELLGAERMVQLELAGEPVLSSDVIETRADVDQTAVEALRSDARDRRVLFKARFDARTPITVSDKVDVLVDIDQLHIFDLASGAKIA